MKWSPPDKNNVMRIENKEKGIAGFILKEEDHYKLYVNNWGIQLKSKSLKKCKKRGISIIEMKKFDKLRIKPQITYKVKECWYREINGCKLKIGVPFENETLYETAIRSTYNIPSEKQSVIPIIKIGRQIVFLDDAKAVYLLTNHSKPKIEDKTTLKCSNPKPIRDPPPKGHEIVFALSGHTPLIKNTKWKTIRRWADSLIKRGEQKRKHITIGALCHQIRNMKMNDDKKEKALEKLKLLYFSDYQYENLKFRSLQK